MINQKKTGVGIKIVKDKPEIIKKIEREVGIYRVKKQEKAGGTDIDIRFVKEISVVLQLNQD